MKKLAFEQAYMAAGLSSNTDDYFSPEEAVLVEIRGGIKMPLSREDKELIEEAKKVIRKNYDPVHWRHTVGAAVRTKSGKVYVGVNCDSVSHGACAEVIAIGSAVTAGEREFDTVAAVLGGESERILPPCGNCRQMMYSYDQTMNVIINEDTKANISELLKYPCD